MVRVGLDWRDLASTYVLCPSDSLVPNFKLERVEVLECVGMSDMNLVGWLEGWSVRDEAEIVKLL